MNDPHEWLAEQFEAHRPHLTNVAYRMLGSLTETEDAIQEAWLKVSRAGADGVQNLGGWLTTVVARVCLDMLRSRKARREDALGVQPPAERTDGSTAEDETLLADSVGLALLVVLETLPPAERVAFVLHDMFDLSFDEIAPIVHRTPTAARQLASRARRRVQGKPAIPDTDLSRQREIVEAFLAASRAGDFEALLSMLDPDVVVRADRAAARGAKPVEVRGASKVARFYAGRAQAARAAMVDGRVGIVVAPRGRLLLAVGVTIRDGRIAEIEAIGDPEKLRQMEFAVLVQ